MASNLYFTVIFCLATIAASTPVESKDMFSKADRGGAGDGIEMEALCDREKDIGRLENDVRTHHLLLRLCN